MKKKNTPKKQYKADSEKLRNRMEIRFTDKELKELKIAVKNSKYNKISEYIRAKIYNKNDDTVLSDAILEKQKEMNMQLLGLGAQLPIISKNLNHISNSLLSEQYPSEASINENIVRLYNWSKEVSDLLKYANKKGVQNISEAMLLKKLSIKEKLIELGGHFPKMGNNLNQIAHKLNAGDTIDNKSIIKEVLKIRDLLLKMFGVFKGLSQ